MAAKKPQKREGPGKKMVMDILRTVIDPEIGVNIVDLGLVYGLLLDGAGKKATIRMTLTTPACPLLYHFISEVQEKVKAAGFKDVLVEMVWDPPWKPEMMSRRAKLMLGIKE